MRLVDDEGNDFIQECKLPSEYNVSEANPVEQLAYMTNFSERRYACISEHLIFLYFLTAEMNIQKILEIGVGHGNSTVAFLYGLKKTGGKLISIDIADWSVARDRVREYRLEENWNYIVNDDTKIEWNEEVDLLFIDTSHEYNHTKAEIKKFEPFVKSGGYIIFHDTVICPQVEKAVDEFYLEHPNYIRYRWFHNSGLQVFKKVVA